MPTFTIAKRELQSYFNSPLAYVVICLSMLLLGVFVFFNLIRPGFWQLDRASLESMFIYVPWLSIVIIPVITMGLLAEERSSGTLEMLITLPVRDWEVILGKYIGALSLMLILVGSTLLYPLLMFYFPWKLGAIDMGPVWSGYLGLVLMSAAGVAVGLLVSSVTKSQVIAFFVTFVVMLILTVVGAFGDVVLGPRVGAVLAHLSFYSHMQNFARGLIDTRSVVYFLSLTALSLMVAFRSLESRKWR